MRKRTHGPVMIAQLLKRLTSHPPHAPSEAEAFELFSKLLDGEVPEVELGAVLTVLAMQPIDAETLAGFCRAAQARTHCLAAPSVARSSVRPLVIPSYSGTLDHPNLMPLLALLASRFGIPVVIHGPLEGHGRIPSVSVFRELGVLPSATLKEAQVELAQGRIAYVPAGLIAPALMQLMALRSRLGYRNCAQSVASLLDPFSGLGLKLLPTADDAESKTIGQVLVRQGESAILFRGGEGEAYADPERRPAIEYFSEGVLRTLFEAETATVSASAQRGYRLPAQADARSTARWIHDALAGKEPLPPPITNLLACCLFAVGYTRDFNYAKAIVAVRTHCLAAA